MKRRKIMADTPDTLFPLIRHLSLRLTQLLARLPFSANQITLASLAVGLGCAWAMTGEGRAMSIAGGVMLVLCYLLDNCDGEIARLKDQCTAFGAFFDTFVDWIVHAAFFAALGMGVAVTRGNGLWLWLGWIAAVGSTINYAIGLVGDWRQQRAAKKEHDPAGRAAAEQLPRPEGWRQWAVYTFRELFRADFCFIVLGLAFFDAVWMLLPLGAVGAQVFWAAQLIKGARDYHV
jgi:phosphatidylglycerophosphate synthase